MHSKISLLHQYIKIALREGMDLVLGKATMHAQQTEGLSYRHRLEILVTVLEGQPLRPLLDRLTTTQLVQAHEFLWSKLVELHYQTQPQEFQRETVTRKMVPSARYQKLQNCDLRLDYCKGVECIGVNPHCAGNKVMNNMEVMAAHIYGFLDPGKNDPVENEMAAAIIA